MADNNDELKSSKDLLINSWSKLNKIVLESQNPGAAFHYELHCFLTALGSRTGDSFTSRYDTLQSALTELQSRHAFTFVNELSKQEEACHVRIEQTLIFDSYSIYLTRDICKLSVVPIRLPELPIQISTRPTITKEEILKAPLPSRMTAREFAESILRLPENQQNLPIVHNDDGRHRFVLAPHFEVIRAEEQYPHYEANSDLSGMATNVLLIVSED